jgi:hypothetical protein
MPGRSPARTSPAGASRPPGKGALFPDCFINAAGVEVQPWVVALAQTAPRYKFTGVPMKSRLPSSTPQWRRMS